MDFVDFSEPDFDGLDLFRTICELTKEMEELHEAEELPSDQSKANDFGWDGVSTDSLSLSKSVVVRLEPLELTAEQKIELLENGRLITRGIVSNNLLSKCSPYAQPNDELSAGAETALVTSDVAPEEFARTRPRRSPRQKKSIQELPFDNSLSCSDVNGRPYNFRKRLLPLENGGKENDQRRAALSCLEAEPKTNVAKKEQRVGRVRREVRKSKSTKLRLSVSRFVSELDIDGGAIEYGETKMTALERTSTIVSNGEDYSAESIELTGKSASAHYSKVVSRSTSVRARRGTRCDWDEFFVLFSAIAAEAHNVRRLKTKRTQACRRWLSCMRNILNRAPI